MAQHLASKLDKAHSFYKLFQTSMQTFRSEAEASSNHDAEAKAKEEEEEEDMKTDGYKGGFSGKDETIKCRTCSADFVFNVGAQIFYTSRGFKHKPVRCGQCRAPQPKIP